MSAYVILITAAVIVLLVEMHTLTFYLMAFAAALGVAACFAALGFSTLPIVISAAITLICCLPLTHLLRRKMKGKESDSVSNDDVGKTVKIVKVHSDDTLSVDYRGTTWSARWDTSTPNTATSSADSAVITKREGNMLHLSPHA